MNPLGPLPMFLTLVALGVLLGLLISDLSNVWMPI